MFPHFETLFWKAGRPRGKNRIENPSLAKASYTIIHDPYFKRISVERYSFGIFDKTLYDTALFDARTLKEREQIRWMREEISESESEKVQAVKDETHRTLFLERQEFQEGLPRLCSIFSPHGLLLARNRLFYEALGDSWNGAVLEDVEGRPILKKRYGLNQEGQFEDLLEEISTFN